MDFSSIPVFYNELTKIPFTMLKLCVGSFLKSISGFLQNPKYILFHVCPHT